MKKIFIESINNRHRSTKFIKRVVSKNATCQYNGKTYRVKQYSVGTPDLFLLLESN